MFASRGALLVATTACLVNGIASVSLVTLINKALVLDRTGYGALAITFGALSVLALVGRVLSGVVFARLSQGTMARMRAYVSQHVARAPLRQVEAIGASRAQSVITDDTTNVSMLFFALPNILMQGSIVLGCLGYLAWLSWPIFVLALGAVLVGSIGYSLGGGMALRGLKAAGQAQDRLFAHFNALFSGAKELKLHDARAQAFLNDSLGEDIDAVRRHRTRAFSAYAFGTGWILFLFYVFLGFVIFAPTAVPGLNPAALAGYVIIFLFMLMPLDGLLNNVPVLNTARVSLGRIEALLSALDRHEAPLPAGERSPFASAESIQVCGASHRYYREHEDTLFQLGPIDMTLRRGEITFLIGGNGSGKTTLAKMLVGLYPPEHGHISAAGHTVTHTNRAHYRQLFSTVFADFHLFEHLQGLGHVDPEMDARANALIARLHLQHKVTIKGGRFSTRALSSGQRKRLALVVAYMEDRPFYLFDEWAADQDPLFKALFYQELLPALAAQGKAILVITHDDRYFSVADHCLKLENGQLIDQHE